MTDEQPSCATCRFLRHFPPDEENERDDIACVRFPPMPYRDEEARAGWPSVHLTDWCGEYQIRRPSDRD